MARLNDWQITQAICAAVLLVLATTGTAFGQQKAALPRTITVLVRPRQMEPQLIKVAAGPVEIVAYNQSTARHLQFILSVERGNQLRQIDLPAFRKTSRELYDLNPGTYLFTEASHPNWVCRIVVSAK